MRGLQFSDLFTFTKIVRKMNIKEDIKGLMTDVTGKSDEEKAKAKERIQIDGIMLFVEHIGDAEQEVYKLLSDISGKTTKEIASSNIKDIMGIIEAIFNDPQFEDFFGQALKLMK